MVPRLGLPPWQVAFTFRAHLWWEGQSFVSQQSSGISVCATRTWPSVLLCPICTKLSQTAPFVERCYQVVQRPVARTRGRRYSNSSQVLLSRSLSVSGWWTERNSTAFKPCCGAGKGTHHTPFPLQSSLQRWLHPCCCLAEAEVRDNPLASNFGLTAK